MSRVSLGIRRGELVKPLILHIYHFSFYGEKRPEYRLWNEDMSIGSLFGNTVVAFLAPMLFAPSAFAEVKAVVDAWGTRRI